MIRTEQDYKRAMKQIAREREMLDVNRKALAKQGFDPEKIERALAPMIGMHLGYVEEVKAYEDAKKGRITPITSLTQMGRTLIALRIASGLNQRQLARQLEVSENQVSRDERNEYHGITIDRVQRILSVLKAQMKKPLEFLPGFVEHKAA